MDASAAPASESNTGILDLNDDCLFEVFKHFDLLELCAIANVNYRFRANSQRYSASRNYKICEFEIGKYLHGMSDAQKFFQVSKILRLFGSNVTSINLGLGGRQSVLNYEIKMTSLLLQYCSEKLIEMKLFDFDINDTYTYNLRHLLPRLQKLTLDSTKWDNSFGKMLPIWSPELRELKIFLSQYSEFSSRIPLDELWHQSFVKLVSFKMMAIRDVTNEDIDAFLKCNPGLKKIGILSCFNIDDRIFEFMAKRVPAIESIQIDNRLKRTADNNFKYIRELSNLKSLEVCSVHMEEPDIIPPLLHETNVANISVEELHVFSFRYRRTDPIKLVDGISKMKHLKTLIFEGVCVFNASQIIEICKNLPQLTELHLIANELELTTSNLLELLKCSSNLELLYCYEPMLKSENQSCIDARTYNKMVRIVQQRREKKHLKVKMIGPFTADLPKELTAQHEEILSLIVNKAKFRWPMPPKPNRCWRL